MSIAGRSHHRLLCGKLDIRPDPEEEPFARRCLKKQVRTDFKFEARWLVHLKLAPPGAEKAWFGGGNM